MVSEFSQAPRRTTGVGRALYEALEDALRRMGILSAYACVACPNPDDEHLTDASSRFHERMGYAKVGEFADCGNKFGAMVRHRVDEEGPGTSRARPETGHALDGANRHRARRSHPGLGACHGSRRRLRTLRASHTKSLIGDAGSCGVNNHNFKDEKLSISTLFRTKHDWNSKIRPAWKWLLGA